MNKRVELLFQGENGQIKVKVSKDLDGVLYVDGKNGESITTWIVNHTQIDNGKGKDTLIVPAEYHIMKKTEAGLTTEVKKVSLKIPLDISVTVKSLGKVETTKIRTGKEEFKRIPLEVSGENIVDPEVWEKLTKEQRDHLRAIDVWAVHDELTKWLGSQNRKPSLYIEALQQIENRTDKKERVVPEFKEVPTHKLIDTDVTLTINANGWNYTKHFTEGSYNNCNGRIVRSFAFVLPRDEIIKHSIKGRFIREKYIFRRHK